MVYINLRLGYHEIVDDFVRVEELVEDVMRIEDLGLLEERVNGKRFIEVSHHMFGND